MKKYLMTGIAALAMGGMFTSCTQDMSIYSGELADYAKQTYEQKFIERFGEPDPNQTWGFGSTTVVGTRGMTRGEMPATPSFRDTNPITKPTMPSYSNTIPEGAKYARDYQNYQNGDVIYINTEYQQLNNPQNTENLTIYVDGNVTYVGQTNQNGNGTVFCVTENSTLKLGAVGNNLTVYLAPNATLDVTQALKWDGTPDYDWQGNPSPLTFQNDHAAIYLNAGSKVNGGNLNLVNGVKVLNEGGTIEATNLTLDQKATLWNEGTIKVTNTLTLTNESSALYNQTGKTIETSTIDLINNNALLFNEGTVSATGDIVLHNTNAEVINYGSLSCASYSQAAGGKTHNHGTVTMSGKTNLTNSNSSWMNDGQWTCGSFDVDNYSASNFNNCKLSVNGDFYLNRGTFSLAANAGVVCNSFTWEDTSDFYLGNSSVLKINGNLLTRNANSGYGLRAIGTEYAVVQAASIIHEGNEQFRMSYYGKLLVATQNHFEQWYKDAPSTNQPAYWYESSVKFTKDGDNIATIPATNCNPGYEGASGGGSDKREKIRIIAEDLSVNQATNEKSDFDFNDIVFDVFYDADKDNGTVSIKPLAAGGELQIYIGSDDNAWELHHLFMEAYPTDPNVTANSYKINTVGNHYQYDCPEKVLPGTWWSGSNIKDIAYSIMIRVRKNNVLNVLEAKKGRVASKIAVGTDYDWCDEREDIDDKFSYTDSDGNKKGKFSEYVGGAHSWDTWYK